VCYLLHVIVPPVNYGLVIILHIYIYMCVCIYIYIYGFLGSVAITDKQIIITEKAVATALLNVHFIKPNCRKALRCKNQGIQYHKKPTR